MKLHELMQQLNEIQQKHGDLTVYLQDTEGFEINEYECFALVVEDNRLTITAWIS